MLFSIIWNIFQIQREPFMKKQNSLNFKNLIYPSWLTQKYSFSRKNVRERYTARLAVYSHLTIMIQLMLLERVGKSIAGRWNEIIQNSCRMSPWKYTFLLPFSLKSKISVLCQTKVHIALHMEFPRASILYATFEVLFNVFCNTKY